ncbi:MAG: cytochrome c biogenesis protein CcsA, partial [Candidatus Omnitrophica bacterium]|nr:cytochrome c biogenesis protein CcsA [Candidatus Omnitrophota bacterium]
GKGVPRDYLSSHYFLIHILSAFVAYASFGLSFIASVLYLSQSHALKSKQVGNFYHRLPPLKDLERFIFYSVVWGVFLLGVGIVSGAFWSNNVFHTFVVREPKSLASIITWFAYGFILLLRARSLIGERKSVVFVLLAFGLVLFTFLGTSFFGTKLHVGI